MKYERTVVDRRNNVDETRLLKKTNLDRTERGLTELLQDAKLNESARYRCEAMIFDNELSLRGRAIVMRKLKKLGAEQVEERYSWGYSFLDAIEKLDKQVIYGDWKYTGVAVVKRKGLRIFICQLFAK